MVEAVHHLAHLQVLGREEVAIQLIQVKKLSLPGFPKRKMNQGQMEVVEVAEVQNPPPLLPRKKRRRISFKLLIKRKILLQLLIMLSHKLLWQIPNSNQGT